MKKKIIRIASGFLSAIIALSALTAICSLFLRTTILTEDFYLDIIATPNYMTKVTDAIKLDYRMQSSYSGIPEEVLAETLDDAALHAMLRSHIRYTVSYLNGAPEYLEPEYPKEMITKPLYAFLEKHGDENGYIPTPDQYALIDEVARDSGEIIKKHICLIDLNLVIERDMFLKAMNVVHILSAALIPSLALLLIACAVLVIFYLEAWRESLTWVLVGLWFAGATICIPSLVLFTTGIAGRLAIDTVYLKFFVDSVLVQTNQFFLLFGMILFVMTTSILCYLAYNKRRKSEKSEKYHDFRMKTTV